MSDTQSTPEDLDAIREQAKRETEHAREVAEKQVDEARQEGHERQAQADSAP